MPLSLTCPCGARFELEDTLAGQEVSCPECQQALKAPALQQMPPRTSGYALASTVAVLVGAFTVIGTVLGVILGAVALVSIARNRQRLAGAGFAIFGIVAGVVFTGLTILAMSDSELFGLGGRLREHNLGDQIDRTGPLEITVPLKRFAITRPTAKWGQAVHIPIEDPNVSGLQENRDLVLVQPARNAFVDVRRLNSLPPAVNAGQEAAIATNDFQPNNAVNNNQFGPPDDPIRPSIHGLRVVPDSYRRLPSQGDAEVTEMQMKLQYGARTWIFLIRVYRSKRGPAYIVRGYAPERNYARADFELRRALDSFKILP